LTAQGSPLTRLHRALGAGNVLLALTTAAELPRVPLPEALAICLLLRDKEPQRYELAALRWHARLCREARLSLADATIALAALGALAGARAESATQALLGVLDSYGLEEAGNTLEAWGKSRAH
jgi:hypothetical protein